MGVKNCQFRQKNWPVMIMQWDNCWKAESILKSAKTDFHSEQTLRNIWVLKRLLPNDAATTVQPPFNHQACHRCYRLLQVPFKAGSTEAVHISRPLTRDRCDPPWHDKRSKNRQMFKLQLTVSNSLIQNNTFQLCIALELVISVFMTNDHYPHYVFLNAFRTDSEINTLLFILKDLITNVVSLSHFPHTVVKALTASMTEKRFLNRYIQNWDE